MNITKNETKLLISAFEEYLYSVEYSTDKARPFVTEDIFDCLGNIQSVTHMVCDALKRENVLCYKENIVNVTVYNDYVLVFTCDKFKTYKLTVDIELLKLLLCDASLSFEVFNSDCPKGHFLKTSDFLKHFGRGVLTKPEHIDMICDVVGVL